MTGKRFKEIRAGAGLTQAQAANAVRRSIDTVRMWERSKNLNVEIIDPLYDKGIEYAINKVAKEAA